MKRGFYLTFLVALAGFWVAGCATTTPRSTLLDRLRAATARTTGCPMEKVAISSHQPGSSTWRARACDKNYACVGIDLADELADCNETEASLAPSPTSTSLYRLPGSATDY
jgi:hypothetical protein